MGIRYLDNLSGFLVKGSNVVRFLNFSGVPMMDIERVFYTHEVVGFSSKRQPKSERNKEIVDLMCAERERGAKEPTISEWNRAGYSVETIVVGRDPNIDVYRSIIFTERECLTRFVYTNPFTDRENHCVVYHDRKGRYHITVLRTVDGIAVDVTDQRARVNDIMQLPQELLNITF